MTHSSAIKSLLSYLLVISFLLTPLSPAMAIIEGSGGGSSNSTPGTNNGGLVGGDNLDDEEDDDEDEESEEEKDRRLAEETRAEIAAAVTAAGLDLEVGAVLGAEPSGSGVTVSGVSMDKEQALAAISAMGDAKSVGAIGVVATNQTLAAYANGDVCAGCVVGLNTATVGTPTEVAKAEADYVISMAGVVGARLVNGLANTVSVQANNLSSAISSIAPTIMPTNTGGTTVVPPSVAAQYQQLGQSLQSAGVSNLGGNQIESGYTYNNETGNLVGLTTGHTYEVSNVGLASNIPEIASANPNSIVRLDTANGYISATDVITGIVHSYDLEGDTLISNYDISAAFSWDGSPYGQYLLLSDSAGGEEYQVLNATAGTPSSQVVSGEFNLGSVPTVINSLAQQFGYNNTIADPYELAALVFSGELSPEARRAIVEAYEENPDFSTLDISIISEAGGIIGASAGQAYATGNTLSDQLAVGAGRPLTVGGAYMSSIQNGSAYNNLESDGEDAMAGFAEALLSGQLTEQHGLAVTAPVAVANHTYSSIYDPDNPNAVPLTSSSAWIAQVNNNATQVGGTYYTEIGYITSELNNSSNWGNLLVDQNPSYDASVYGDYTSNIYTGDYIANIYTIVSSVPVSSIGVVDLGNDSGINISDIYSSIYSPVMGIGSNNQPSSNGSTDTSFQPVSTTPAPSGNCSNCVEIESVVCKATDSCTVDAEYASRLDFLAQNSDLSFRVTEGYPPTVNHANPCHSNGTCTDIGFTGVPYNSETVNQFIEEAENAGLRAVFESVTAEGCEGIDSCTVISWATASHFSLYMGANEPNFDTDNNSSPSNTTNGSALGWLGDVLSAGADAVGTAAEDALNSEAVQELDAAMDNPLFGLYVWAVNTFGGGGGGNLNDFPTDNNNNSDDSDDAPPCPSKPGEQDTYKAWRSQNGYPPCTATSTPSTSGQAGAVFIPFLDSDFVQYLLNLFGWRKSDEATKSTNMPTTAKQSSIAIVKITIDDTHKVVALSRPDLEALIADESIDAKERVMLLEKLKEIPVIFDETGTLVYSNGVYTPPVENGREVSTNQTYSYVIEHIDGNGNIISTTASADVSDNIFSDALRSLLGENKPFTISDVANVTYYLTDPDASIPSDEYYLYTVTTIDGRSRTIEIPHFTPIRLMEERFQKIGYNGDVLALTSIATEKEPEPRTFDKVSDFVTNLLGKFVDAIKANPSTSEEGPNTVLPEISSDLSTADIKSINIYPNSTLTCPDLPELNQGFMYTVTLTDRANIQKYTNITDGRCGSTDPLLMVAETARHLQEHYGISDTTYESIASKTAFHTEVTAFIPGVTSKVIGGPSTEEETPDLPEEPETPDTSSSSTPTQLPNLTNEVVFEIKAVGSDGKVLADWVQTEQITISDGVELYFRWNGSSYQQCLAFLNDNGNYSLTRSNRAMITGNTEEEKYDVTERSATYRVECGGQRNNEFGVDAREIEVTVQ